MGNVICCTCVMHYINLLALFFSVVTYQQYPMVINQYKFSKTNI